MREDGDGWRRCAAGHRHWGRHGAAGLLLRAPDGQLLLQHRAQRSHHGGTWGVPGGARDSGETAIGTALRETAEETDLDVSAVRVDGLILDDHGSWSYTTVLGSVATPVAVEPANWESTELRWLRAGEVADLPLHPGFAAWPELAALPRQLVLVVDAANVVGSRPDGWWRDRLGAATRLRTSLELLVATGIDGEDLAAAGARVAAGGAPVRQVCSEETLSYQWFPEIVLVVEGAARPLTAGEGGLEVRAAAGSGDEEIVAVVSERVRRAPADLVLCVTVDRELSRRCVDEGAQVVRPGWLFSLLDRAGDPS